MPVATPTEPEKVKILHLSIDESRRTYDHIANTYDQLRAKALAIIAGEIAIVAFIFTGDSLKIPHVYYGLIFFFVAIVFMLAAFGGLLWTLAALQWRIPSDLAQTSKLLTSYDTELEFLEYLNDDYSAVAQYCAQCVDKKSKMFDKALYFLEAGAIILLVLKFGGANL